MTDLFGERIEAESYQGMKTYEARMRRLRRKERNLKIRNLYIDMTGMTGGVLCVFCKFAEWEGGCCGESYAICKHPIEEVSNEVYGLCEGMEPFSDCWGFREKYPRELAVNIVGVILQDFYRDEWGFIAYPPDGATVFNYDKKVRINPPEVCMKGRKCLYKNVLCQEGYCSDCQIYIDYKKGG